jgi:hypothetical protein
MGETVSANRAAIDDDDDDDDGEREGFFKCFIALSLALGERD